MEIWQSRLLTSSMKREKCNKKRFITFDPGYSTRKIEDQEDLRQWSESEFTVPSWRVFVCDSERSAFFKKVVVECSNSSVAMISLVYKLQPSLETTPLGIKALKRHCKYFAVYLSFQWFRKVLKGHRSQIIGLKKGQSRRTFQNLSAVIDHAKPIEALKSKSKAQLVHLRPLMCF